MSTPDLDVEPLRRDDLYRATRTGIELRDVGEGTRTMTGHFAVFNQWTTIDSVFEGRFLERIAPGAFTRTFKNNRDGMRVLFQHGRDPVVGNKPLGPIRSLEEDEHGAAYEVDLLDTTYNRDLLPGLEEGLYGASFRFRVLKQDMVKKPVPSDQNPDGVPERTITEAQVMEFGPVTFPAYAGATAGVRSMTDEFIFEQFVSSDRLRDLVSFIPHIDEAPAAATPIGEPESPALPDGPGSRHSDSRTRTGTKPLYGATNRSRPSWLLKTSL